MRAAVDKATAALDLPDAYAAHEHLAHLLAAAVDDMEPATRAKMLGQTAPPLLRVLDALTAAAVAPAERDDDHRRRGMTRAEAEEFLQRLGGADGSAGA